VEFINKIEKQLLGWNKGTPNLPRQAQRWLGDNVWWIVLAGAILSGIAFLFGLGGLLRLISLEGSASNSYYVSDDYTSIRIMEAAISLFFTTVIGLLLALAVRPLQRKSKKGWVLLFLAFFVQAISVLVSAVLTFSFAGFVITVLFGAIGLAIGAYFLFEIHGEFAHPVQPTAKAVEPPEES
jgi:hypothetical protein